MLNDILGVNSLFVNMTRENPISFYCEKKNNNNNKNSDSVLYSCGIDVT